MSVSCFIFRIRGLDLNFDFKGFPSTCIIFELRFTCLFEKQSLHVSQNGLEVLEIDNFLTYTGDLVLQPLREMCTNTEFFLVHIFLYSD